ncbi:MAG: DUF58 domain-containing protein, partial [Acidimicrobiia bacterium]
GRADLALRNDGDRPTGVLSATDAFDGGRRVARFLVPPMARGETAEAAYRLPTGRRGIYLVGPLTVSVSDAFGVAEATITAAGTERFVVYPKVEDVLSLPGASNQEARVGSSQASRVPIGLDFFGLREYEMGDDLRRVHWRSTARTGELMLRQDEMPWESRTTVFFDTRPATHTSESFERAVEVAASLVTAHCRGRRHLRFLTSGGVEIRSAGKERYAQIMEFLAEVAPEGADRFNLVVESLRRNGTAGPLAAVVANAGKADLAALGTLSTRNLVALAILRPSAYGGVDVGPPPIVPGTMVVPIGTGSPFRTAWNQAVISCRRGATVRS